MSQRGLVSLLSELAFGTSKAAAPPLATVSTKVLTGSLRHWPSARRKQKRERGFTVRFFKISSYNTNERTKKKKKRRGGDCLQLHELNGKMAKNKIRRVYDRKRT